MQFKGMNLCDFCFEPVEPGTVCKKCGLTHETYQLEAGLLAPGTNLIGKYIIGRALGRGGFGATYLAYSSALDKPVAIKEYFPLSIAYRGKGEECVSVVSEEKKAIFDKGASRFFKEAKTMSTFNKVENIVSVYEFFYANDTVYFSMEYLDGIDLKKYTDQKGGVLTEAETVDIWKRVSNALMIVHSTQLLHRDISPDNIYMCSNGNVKLIDFGAAKQVVSDESQNYSVVVKQGFAPTEQYSKKGTQGVWTDIYALGATMYYVLTGKIPAGAVDRLENPQLEYNPANPVSKELQDIIYKCMEVKVSDRYQSVIDLQGDLQSLVIAQPTPAPVAAKTEPETVQQEEEKPVISPSQAQNNVSFIPSIAPDQAPVKEQPKKKQPAVAGKKGFSMKKIGIIAASCVVAIGLVVGASFAISNSSKVAKINDTTDKVQDQAPGVTFNGTPVDLQYPLMDKDDVHMMSEDDIFDMFGVAYTEEDGFIKFEIGEDKYSIDIENKKILRNDETAVEFKVDVMKNSEDATMLPLKDCAQIFNASVNMNNKNNVLEIKTLGSGKAEEKQELTEGDESSKEKETEKVTDSKPKCPTCGSTAHTVHPKDKVKCPTCGSTAHTVHPKAKCPECGSTAHTVHPKAKCPECGSTAHTVHPKAKCPECGSTAHTVHPNKEQPKQDPAPAKEAPKCPVCGSTSHTVHPTCPTCGSTSHTVHPTPTCPVCGSTSHTVHPQGCPECGSTYHTVHPSARCPVCGSTSHTVHPQV